MRVCSRCGTDEVTVRFRPKRPECYPCMYARQEKWRHANKDKIARRTRENNLLRNYKITLKQFDEMLKKQGGVCAICKNRCTSKPNLAVDHDHKTGLVRGLLCNACNTGLGKFFDDIVRLRAAVDYLSPK